MPVYTYPRQRHARPPFAPTHTGCYRNRSIESGSDAKSSGQPDNTGSANTGRTAYSESDSKSDANTQSDTKRQSDANAESKSKRQPNPRTDTKPDTKSESRASARLISLMRAICVICVCVGHR